MADDFTFKQGQAGGAELQEALDQIAKELAEPDSEAAKSAREAGIGPEELADVELTAREGKAGVDPVLTPIIIGVGVKLGSSAAEKLWVAVIWPRLKRRFGAKAVGDRVT